MNKSSSLFFNSKQNTTASSVNLKNSKNKLVLKNNSNNVRQTTFYSTSKSFFNNSNIISYQETKISNNKNNKKQILNSTRDKSFFKIAKKEISNQQSSNLQVNALNDFMSKNEFYFDINKWKTTRTPTLLLNKANKASNNDNNNCNQYRKTENTRIGIKFNKTNYFLLHSVTLSKQRFIDLFSLKESQQIDFNLDFFDKLSCFNHILLLTDKDFNMMKSENNVPK